MYNVRIGWVKKKARSTFSFFKKNFAIVLTWGFTVNTPYMSYLSWPAQAYKPHSTTSDLMLGEIMFSEQSPVAT